MKRSERHEMYKEARELIANDVYQFGCPVLVHVASLSNKYTIKTMFPEFYAFKKSDKFMINVWFDTKEERLAAFDSCIKQTAPSLKRALNLFKK